MREESTCAAFCQRCRGVKGHERGGAKRRARGAPSTQHTRLSRVRIALLLMKKKGASFGGGDGQRKGRGGKAYGVAGGGSSSLENLHAMVAGVGHDDAPVAVDGDAAQGAVELPVA